MDAADGWRLFISIYKYFTTNQLISYSVRSTIILGFDLWKYGGNYGPTCN